MFPDTPSTAHRSPRTAPSRLAALSALSALSALCSITVFCGDCNCGCPELFLDREAEEPRRIVLADDFGQHVQMSLDQLEQLVRDAKSGALDELIAQASAN